VAAGILPAVEPRHLARRFQRDLPSLRLRFPKPKPGGGTPALYVRPEA
jgi:hypothetical protein